MSAADGLVRNQEVAGATPATLTISGRQADISWLHLSRKQDRREPRSVRYRRLPPILLPHDHMIGLMALKPSEHAGIEDARNDSYPTEDGMNSVFDKAVICFIC